MGALILLGKQHKQLPFDAPYMPERISCSVWWTSIPNREVVRLV